MLSMNWECAVSGRRFGIAWNKECCGSACIYNGESSQSLGSFTG